MAQIKKFSQTSPDATLQKAAAAGKDGYGGLARLAHVNAVIDYIQGTVGVVYEDELQALIGGLKIGDLYREPLGSVKIVYGDEEAAEGYAIYLVEQEAEAAAKAKKAAEDAEKKAKVKAAEEEEK
ncbi:MAG: hypothetical protein CMH79_03925 [Nitrospinae bacterium]|nr:hypothetical protein [Nitrospinota bacterium]